MNKLQRIRQIENLSGYGIKNFQGKIKSLKKKNYHVLEVPVSGDAPKDFIQLYEYSQGTRLIDRPAKWPRYIAKVGHKWYPNESLTEELLNKIGAELGVLVAESELRMVDNQLRFLSKYFLKKDEILVHGAQIYSSYLEESTDQFVEQIEKQGWSREWFTFQFTDSAIKSVFPTKHKQLMLSFIKMLMFDAIVGNNDRHFYNWGVITDLRGKKSPTFAPIYDTARGLFWNFSEDKISKMLLSNGKIEQAQFSKYLNGARPKIGWEGKKAVNHFELIKHISLTYPEYILTLQTFLSSKREAKILKMIDSQEFKSFFSAKRKILIVHCLMDRFAKLRSILNISYDPKTPP